MDTRTPPPLSSAPLDATRTSASAPRKESWTQRYKYVILVVVLATLLTVILVPVLHNKSKKSKNSTSGAANAATTNGALNRGNAAVLSSSRPATPPAQPEERDVSSNTKPRRVRNLPDMSGGNVPLPQEVHDAFLYNLQNERDLNLTRYVYEDEHAEHAFKGAGTTRKKLYTPAMLAAKRNTRPQTAPKSIL